MSKEIFNVKNGKFSPYLALVLWLHETVSKSMTAPLDHFIPKTSPVSTGMYSAGVRFMLFTPAFVGVISTLPTSLIKQRQFSSQVNCHHIPLQEVLLLMEILPKANMHVYVRRGGYKIQQFR